MNQIATGRFIAQLRKEKNLTQAQLADALGVSNKTVSKWETGKCMPDYGLIEPLCQALDITIAELLGGEAAARDAAAADNMQLLDLLRRTQALEQQKNMLYGIVLIVMGIALLALSDSIGGSPVRDFLSGMLLGVGIGVIPIGLIITGRTLPKL